MIHHLGGSAEAANSLLDFIASRVSSSGISSIDFAYWGTFDSEATIDHQHLFNLAAKCSNLRSLTMNFMGSASSQMKDTIWNMALTMVKQASSLSSLSLHCSGLGGSGYDLCASLQESNTTSLNLMSFASNQGLFSSEEVCKQWAALIKKQTGLAHLHLEYCRVSEENKAVIREALPSTCADFSCGDMHPSEMCGFEDD